MRTARKVNAIIWAVIAVVIMAGIYFQWSGYGEYNVGSFFGSLVMYGGGCVFAGYLIDEKLRDNDR